MKKQIKAPKIQLSNVDDSQPIRCTVQNTVIRMLTEMLEYGRKIEGKVKDMKSEIKENVK